MLDPLNNISNELLHFWREKQVNEGLIGTMAFPLTNESYLNLFDNIISLRISNVADLKLVRDKIHFGDEINPSKLELGTFLVKLRGHEYEVVRLDDYF